MPLKDWIKTLPDDFTIFVSRTTQDEIVTAFSVVLIHEGKCISRYDTAHGRAHRDVLGRKKGWIKAEICKNLTYNEAFARALKDYEENYRSYFYEYSQT